MWKDKNHQAKKGMRNILQENMYSTYAPVAVYVECESGGGSGESFFTV